MDANSSRIPSPDVSALRRRFEEPSTVNPAKVKNQEKIDQQRSKNLNVNKLSPNALQPFQATKEPASKTESRTTKIFQRETGSSIQNLQMHVGKLDIEKRKMQLKMTTPEQFNKQINNLADEICGLSLSEAADPKQQSSIDEMKQKLLDQAKDSPLLHQALTKKFKAHDGLIRTLQNTDQPLAKGETTTSFLKKNGVSEADIEKEAKLLDTDVKTAEMKISRRTVTLLQGGNKSGHTGAIGKTAEELNLNPSVVKAAYKLFKEATRANGEDSIQKLDSERVSLIRADKDIYVQPEKVMGVGSFKSTFGLTHIFGETVTPMVSQMPHESIPVYVEPQKAQPQEAPNQPHKENFPTQESMKSMNMTMDSVNFDSESMVIHDTMTSEVSSDTMVYTDQLKENEIDPGDSGSVVVNDTLDESSSTFNVIDDESMQSVVINEDSTQSLSESDSVVVNQAPLPKPAPQFNMNDLKLREAQIRNRSLEAMNLGDLTIHEKILSDKISEELPNLEKPLHETSSAELSSLVKSIKMEMKAPDSLLGTLIEELVATRARKEKCEAYTQWAQSARSEAIARDEDEYNAEIDMQLNMRGDYLEPLHKVITLEGPDQTVTKTILKPKAGKELPPNEFHSESLKPHDIDTLFEAAQNGQLSPQEYLFSLQTLHDAMKGVKEMKDMQMIHRDLKPANILISATGRGMITDFGTVVKNEGDVKKTGYGGTPLYSSPEQAAVTSNFLVAMDMDSQSDVWSMGMILQDTLVSSGLGSHPVFKSRLAASNPHMTLSHLTGIYSNTTKQKEYLEDLATFVNQAPNEEAKELRQLIADCTHPNPLKRCTIEEAIDRFGKFIEKAKADPGKLYDVSQEYPMVA